jgi:hypothetical protein
MEKTKMNSHERSLESRRHSLDEKIASEQSRPYPDNLILSDLKKKKLALKDELLKH